jgi:thiol-disulfide isomerase/thioredoxin
MNRSIFLTFFIFLCLAPLSAKNTTISGLATTYKGDDIVFKTYKDYITLDEVELFRAKVDTSGHFSITLPINETVYVFTCLGIYKGHMYVEPGEKYNIIFPDKQDKTPAEKSNPFYEYTEFMIGISKGGMYELNFMIRSFDNSYFPYFNKLALNVKTQANPKELERAIAEMQKPWDSIQNDFFKQYIYYRLGMLRLLGYQYKTKTVSVEYFQKSKILYRHIAYMELFKQVYDKYFTFFSATPEGKQIFDDINHKKSYSSLKKTLQQDEVLKNDSLLELVVLKNLYDNFYSDKFSREALVVILDSLSASTTNSMHKQIAANIRIKVTSLMPGYAPFAFSLYDRNKNLVNLRDLKGSYVYLNFCTCSSYSCFKEFEALQKLQDKYGSKMRIITVVCDGSLSDMQNFLSKNKYSWIFLNYTNQPEVMENYRIKAYPVYVFIDKDGRIMYSPCLSPGENFESILEKLLRKRGEL